MSGVMDGEDGAEEEDDGKEEQTAEGDAEGALSVEETAEESKDVPQEEVRTWKPWMSTIKLFLLKEKKQRRQISTHILSHCAHVTL